MNAVVESPARSAASALREVGVSRMSVADVVQQAKAIQEVMAAVMKPNVHYGVIPGTDKPTLYKAGAEKLCLTFHISDEYRVEDLSTGPDAIRYRVTCIGRHQTSGINMGQGIGEAQTGEEKYRWRKAVCEEEFEATPVNLRRVKYGKKSGGYYTIKQVRTEPADLANTVLKMAAKRAKTAMVLNALAASDAFNQDLEDLDETLRAHLTEDEREDATQTLRAELIAKVNAAKSEADLKVTSKECVARLQAIKDTEGYAQLVKAVQARGAALKSATPPPATKTPAADQKADPWVDDFNRGERNA